MSARQVRRRMRISAPAAIRKLNASYAVADFFGAFRFDAHGIATFRTGAKRLGMT